LTKLSNASMSNLTNNRMSKAQEEVNEFLKLIPDYGIDIASAAYMYFKQQELDKEFISEISKLLTPSEENELNELYQWDIMKANMK